MSQKESALDELIALSNAKGYQNWDTSNKDYNIHSWTFGQENIFCLHVRFDRYWRIVNATYTKFGDKRDAERELYVLQTEKDKRHKIYWILNFLPDDFAWWDKTLERELVWNP